MKFITSPAPVTHHDAAHHAVDRDIRRLRQLLVDLAETVNLAQPREDSLNHPATAQNSEAARLLLQPVALVQFLLGILPETPCVSPVNPHQFQPGELPSQALCQQASLAVPIREVGPVHACSR